LALIPRLAAAMSSTQAETATTSGFDAAPCIDDQLDTFCHTLTEANPWLSIMIPNNPMSPASHVQI
jgi:hypothetical protein